MALLRRRINLRIQLGEGAYGESGTDTVDLTGYRVAARIIKAGGPSMGTAQVQVWGMALDLMNKLSTLGMVVTLLRRNTLTISAGDDENGLSVVFVGQITNAWSDFQAAPQVPFIIEAHTGSFDAVKPIPVSTFSGVTDVAVILSGLASTMGKRFENNGVSVKLANPYLSGSARDQALAVVQAAGIEWNGLDQDVLAIWPAGGKRGGLSPLISPETGMVGYPSYTANGIMLKTIFNRDVGFGGGIVVQSDLTPANGTWNVFSIDHDLQSLVPGGNWFSNIGAARPGVTVVR